MVRKSLSQVVTWPAVTRVLSQSNRENNGNEVGMIFSLNFLNIYMCIPKCSMNYFLGQCMNMFFGLVLHMYAFFFINFSLERFFLYVLCQPPLTENGTSLKNYYYVSLTVCIFFQSISILSTQDTAAVKHQPHVLWSSLNNYLRRCSIAMLMFFLLTG